MEIEEQERETVFPGEAKLDAEGPEHLESEVVRLREELASERERALRTLIVVR